MSAGSLFMKKPSSVLPWSADGGGKNGKKFFTFHFYNFSRKLALFLFCFHFVGLDQRENEYESFKSKLTSTADQINVNSSVLKDSDEMKSVTDNDDKWRQQETQLRFVQQEHTAMLNKLHLEIENLQIKHASNR